MSEVERLSTFHIEREEIGKITLCGSTKYRAEYELWNKRLTLAGFLVYSVSGFGHSGDLFTDEEKARLDQIHLAKIDASHAIVVINPGGYIGDSTRREIEHATASGKPVYYTHQGRTVYQLRTGPDGASSLRYTAFDYAPRPPATPASREDKTPPLLSGGEGSMASGVHARSAAAQDTAGGWRTIWTAPTDGTPFLATTRVFVGGSFSHNDTHIVALDDETGEIHPDYEQGWRLDDYEFWTAIPTPPSPAPASRRTDPPNDVAEAFRKGAMFALGREPWDDADDFFSLWGVDYAQGKPLPSRTDPPQLDAEERS